MRGAVAMMLGVACPVCGPDRRSEPVLAARTPRSCQSLYVTRDAARQAEWRRLDIRLCSTCGLGWNAAFEVGDVQAQGDPDYYCSFAASPLARARQESTARVVASRFGLAGKSVVEIGSGDGLFLAAAAEAGARCVGYEPSPSVITGRLHRNVVIRREPFPFGDPSRVAGPVDLVVMRHVLEHLPDAVGALRTLADSTFGGRHAEHLLVEVPNLTYLLEHRLYGDFFYDHVWYFSDVALRAVLAGTGWEPIGRLEMVDEFLGVVARPGTFREGGRIDEQALASVVEAAASFRRSVADWLRDARATIDRLRTDAARLGAWGAGSRGVAALNLLAIAPGDLACLVDSDTNKHGRFVPGLGLPVEGPGALAREGVTAVLVTSHTFFEEIRSAAAAVCGSDITVIPMFPPVAASGGRAR